jgi:hypothetical protein
MLVVEEKVTKKFLPHLYQKKKKYQSIFFLKT